MGTYALVGISITMQREELGFSLVSATKQLPAAWRSTKEWKTLRLSRRLVSLAKKPSTALSHEDDVGVRWKTNRLWRSSQARAFGCLLVVDRPVRAVTTLSSICFCK